MTITKVKWRRFNIGVPLRALWVLFFLAAVPKVFGLTPMVEYNDLVAGEGEKGCRDGPFTSALFNLPTGLAIDPDGHPALCCRHQ